MALVYWDSMMFIYLLEAHPQFGKRARHIAEVAAARGDRIATSALTLGEVLVRPVRNGEARNVERIQAYFSSGAIEVRPFTVQTAESFAAIRAVDRVLPADAIHLATAAEMETDLFLTNDKNLHGKKFGGIGFIAPLDINLF